MRCWAAGGDSPAPSVSLQSMSICISPGSIHWIFFVLLRGWSPVSSGPGTHLWRCVLLVCEALESHCILQTSCIKPMLFAPGRRHSAPTLPVTEVSVLPPVGGVTPGAWRRAWGHDALPLPHLDPTCLISDGACFAQQSLGNTVLEPCILYDHILSHVAPGHNCLYYT